MPANEPQTTHWSGTGQLRGGRWGIWFFITMLRVFGLGFTQILTVPVAIYFSFASPDVAATMDYHRRVFGPVPWWKKRWLVFRHFLSFGRALIDRTAILAGDTHHFSFTFDGEEHLRDAVAEGRGVLLLTAHLGNWEAAGQLLTRIDAIINVTGFDHESPEIRALLQNASRAKFRLLPLTDSPTDVIALVAALRRGEVVAMMGDRAYGSSSTQLNFIQGAASFPIGAYMLAATAGSPLVHVFSLRERGGHYRFLGFPAQNLQLPGRAERANYLQACAGSFAHNLENVLKRDPLQWYNFFPFWDKPPRETRAQREFRTQPNPLP